MISFNQFIKLKEALSFDDPLAQSILKIKDKSSGIITFEFNLDNDYYQIDIFNVPEIIYIENTKISTLNLMEITLKLNGTYKLTNKMGMQANTVYNMLLNAIKQAHEHFGENNVHGYQFLGAQSQQNIMYDRLMKRFSPNLITWSYMIYLKPESVQKLKDENPHMIEEINEKIDQSTLEKEISLQQAKENKNLERSLRRQP